MSRIKKLSIMVIMLSMAIGIQISSSSLAYAAPGSADLNLSVWAIDNSGQVFASTVCNGGDETVIQFKFTNTLTGVVIDTLVSFPSDSNPATDSGSIDQDTGIWTGVLENTQCINIAHINSIVGDYGDFMTSTATISDSKLVGNIDNDETGFDANNTVVSAPVEIVPQPDLALSTRLLTPGTISNGTEITYETTVSNIGEGPDPSGDQHNVLFIIPEDVTYGSFEVTSATAPYEVDNCQTGPPQMISSVVPYTGTLIMCQGTLSADLEAGSNYSILFHMTASASFVSGSTEVIGAVGGGDRDTLLVQKSLIAQENPFELDINNIVHLQYDDQALQATVARCPGQGETTTNGRGCFRITFNKKIYAPSFTTSSINLGGKGTVDTLVQLDDFTWEVRVKDITPGATLTFLLNLNTVQDYNAVMNSTQVLGINTIRYEVDGEAASGSLPETGFNQAGFDTALLLLALGVLMVAFTYRKKQTA